MTALDVIRQNYLTEQEVCEALRIKPSTLRSRISVGSNHPPFVVIDRVRFYPKDMFIQWIGKHPIIWAVKDKPRRAG